MSTIVRDATRDNQQGLAGAAYTVTTPLRIDQFAYELETAAHLDAPASLATEDDPSIASVSSPAEIFVLTTIDSAVVLSVGTAHTPDPAWTAVTPVPTSAAVKEKILAGAVLTPQEVSVGLQDIWSQIQSLDTVVFAPPST